MEKNEKLCSTCKTGIDMLKLDPKAPMCVYMSLYKKNGCSMYVPICGGDKKCEY